MTKFRHVYFFAIGSLSIQASEQKLDYATYQEPLESEYFKLPEISKEEVSTLDEQTFRNLVIDGQIFVLRGAGPHFGPIANWSCDDFRNDEVFSKAKMDRAYAQQKKGKKDPGTAQIGGTDWLNSQVPTGAADASAPKFSPFYFGIKDVQYDDGPGKKMGWNMDMLDRVHNLTALPPWMDKKCRRDQYTTPEFWFNGQKGSGAQAHIDTHVQATVALQIVGSRRWRIQILNERKLPHVGFLYKDGSVYKEGGFEQPTVVYLNEGDALVFGPGFIHETMNLHDQCAATMINQFNHPMAARLYRRFLKRYRRSPDLHESWSFIRDWAFLGKYTVKKLQAKAGKGLSAAEARTFAPSIFEKADKNGNGKIEDKECDRNCIAFNDLDEDGVVTLEEFTDVFAFWAANEEEVWRELPKQFHKLQYSEMLENGQSKKTEKHKEETLKKEKELHTKAKAEL